MPREREPNLEDFQSFGKKRKKRKNVDFAVLDVVDKIPTTIVLPSDDVNLTSKSVLGETTEAFDEISTAFVALGASFTVFGNTIRTQAYGLGNTMKASITNISTRTSTLVQKFKDMGTNLANNLKL